MTSGAPLAAVTAFVFTLAIQFTYQRQITVAFVWRGLFAAGLVVLLYLARDFIARRRTRGSQSP